MLRVGLTGGIACGKSHVLRGLGRAGFATLDLDAVAHALTAPGGAAVAPLLRAFGPGIGAADGGIDRHALGAVVFRDAGARARLNGIVHPLVRAEEQQRVRALGAVSDVLVVDGALLVETGGHLRFDRLVVVHCPLDVQIERLRRRDGLDEGEARRRIAAQMPVEEKRRFASFELDTAYPAQETDRQVAALVAELGRLAARGPSLAGVRLSRAPLARCLKEGPDRGPRGWQTAALLRVAAARGRLDLGELLAQLEPGHEAAWYETLEGRGVADLQAAAAAGLVAGLFELTCGRHDATHGLASAASLARLVARASVAIAGACLACEALLGVASQGAVPAEWRSSYGGWRLEGGKWGDVIPAEPIAAALDSAARHRGDVDAARGLCRSVGGDLALCGALVALSSATGSAEAPGGELAELAGSLCSCVVEPWTTRAPATGGGRP